SVVPMSLAQDTTPPSLEELSNSPVIEEHMSPEISVRADGQRKSGSSRKRQKISLACEECRARKIKCDGLRPECSACRQAPKGIRACRYLSEPSRLSGHKRAMQSLHDRLAYLEAKLREAEAHKSAETRDNNDKEQDEEPSIYPFLCWPIFMEAYNRLWLSDSDVKNMPQLTGIGLGGQNCSIPVFYCALNAAFALATHFTDAPANQRKERAAPFVRRSRHLMRLDFLDHGDLSTIQALLILARYLQNTGLSTRCWNVVGTAHRMAQGLGLHLEVNPSAASELETDIRRRVWHSCVCLETVAGMLTGRPCSNPDVAKVPFPNLLDTAVSKPSSPERTTNQGDPDTSSPIFFTHAIKLNQILNRILRNVYGSSKMPENSTSHDNNNEESYLAQRLASIIVLDQELDRFKAELPDSLSTLKDDSPPHDDDMLAHQRHVLHTRFLHIRSLLYRPLLVQVYRNVKASGKAHWRKTSLNTLNKAFVEKCSLACIATAQALINHISTTAGPIYGGSPWFTSYSNGCLDMYHAALVIIIADICYSDLDYPDHDSFHKSWKMCQDFFRRMLEYDSEVSQYFRGLEHISKSIGSMHESSEDYEAALELGVPQQWHQDFLFDDVTNSSLDQILTLAGGELMPSMSNVIGVEPSTSSNQLWTLFK
ncbi:unnamed protein product, partial [Clonostachys byssicola]